MPIVTCPACGKGFPLDSSEAALYERVICPRCDAVLDVVDEDPITLEEVES
jgi:lysine biosynthesis protein LysW